MRFAMTLIVLAVMWLFREWAGWLAAAGMTFCYLMSLKREDANEKRIAALEGQLGYVTTSKRSVSEIIDARRSTVET